MDCFVSVACYTTLVFVLLFVFRVRRPSLLLAVAVESFTSSMLLLFLLRLERYFNPVLCVYFAEDSFARIAVTVFFSHRSIDLRSTSTACTTTSIILYYIIIVYYIQYYISLYLLYILLYYSIVYMDRLVWIEHQPTHSDPWAQLTEGGMARTCPSPGYITFPRICHVPIHLFMSHPTEYIMSRRISLHVPASQNVSGPLQFAMFVWFL
jgi:hypothetical protein